MKPTNYSFYMSAAKEFLKSPGLKRATGTGAIGGACAGMGIAIGVEAIFALLTFGGSLEGNKSFFDKKNTMLIAATTGAGAVTGFSTYSLFKLGQAVIAAGITRKPRW